MIYKHLRGIENGGITDMLVSIDSFEDDGYELEDYFKPGATEVELIGDVEIDSDDLPDILASE